MGPHGTVWPPLPLLLLPMCMSVCAVLCYSCRSAFFAPWPQPYSYTLPCTPTLSSLPLFGMHAHPLFPPSVWRVPRLAHSRARVLALSFPLDLGTCVPGLPRARTSLRTGDPSHHGLSPAARPVLAQRDRGALSSHVLHRVQLPQLCRVSAQPSHRGLVVFITVVPHRPCQTTGHHSDMARGYCT